MQGSANRPARSVLPVGTSVEVRNRYRGSWSSGFEVADTTERGYWLRRASDRHVLPTPFQPDEIRRAS